MLNISLDLATRKIIMFGLIGLALASAAVVALQLRPPTVLPSTGTLNVAETDSPAVVSSFDPGHKCEIASLNVTVDSILVHRAGALDLTGEWVSVLNNTRTFDLFQLNNTSQLVQAARLNEGTITLIRIHVSSAVARLSSTATTVEVVVSGRGNLEISASGAEVRSGLVTTINMHISPHVVCEGNGQVRLTPVIGKLEVSNDS